ncbi:MAG: hypothetical protein IPI91_20510 [Flavobacteriales bacterium]|nr:hypothetical protein [Flavobacteriales bacterium]
MDGTLNPDIRAQKSVHFLLGMDRRFPIWHRPFKFVAEVYYKHITDLIPLRGSNVRIFGDQQCESLCDRSPSEAQRGIH